MSKYRSNLKFLEYAMLGIPIIVSDSQIYKDIAIHEKNCLIVKNTSTDWTEAITRLIKDKKLRKDLANNAFNDVITNYVSSNSQLSTFEKIIRNINNYGIGNL